MWGVQVGVLDPRLCAHVFCAAHRGGAPGQPHPGLLDCRALPSLAPGSKGRLLHWVKRALADVKDCCFMGSFEVSVCVCVFYLEVQIIQKSVYQSVYIIARQGAVSSDCSHMLALLFIKRDGQSVGYTQQVSGTRALRAGCCSTLPRWVPTPTAASTSTSCALS